MEDKKIRKGICKNYGDCDKAGAKEIIEVGQGEPFECPECHQPLTEVDDKGKPINKPVGKKKGTKSKVSPVVYIVGGVIAILLGFTVWYICQPKVPVQQIPGPEEIDTIEVDTAEVDTATPIDTLPPVIDPEPTTEEDSLKKVPEQKPQTDPKPGPEPPRTPAVHKLSYGTWKGGWKNGKPHGEGTLTYSAETVIDSRDSKGRVAQPGEYIIGTWDEGHLVDGRWFKKDGNKETIIIGKAG